MRRRSESPAEGCRHASFAPISRCAARASDGVALVSTLDYTLDLVDAHAFDLYSSLYACSETMRHIGPVWSSDQIRESFSKVLASNQAGVAAYRCWVIYALDRERVGIAALVRQGASAELGIMLLPLWRGRGVAVSVLPALIAYAFADLSVEEVVARHLRKNQAGAAVVRALGFRQRPCAEPGWDAWVLERGSGKSG